MRATRYARSRSANARRCPAAVARRAASNPRWTVKRRAPREPARGKKTRAIQRLGSVGGGGPSAHLAVAHSALISPSASCTVRLFGCPLTLRSLSMTESTSSPEPAILVSGRPLPSNQRLATSGLPGDPGMRACRGARTRVAAFDVRHRLYLRSLRGRRRGGSPTRASPSGAPKSATHGL